MKPIIAGEGLGFCVCGSHVEPGESIVMVKGRAAHVGCQKKAVQQVADQQMGLWRTDFLFDETQLEALQRAEEVTGADHVRFDGETVRAIDIPRLAGQIAKVFELMRDGKYRTLTEIAKATGSMETSASARLRDLRKERFGAHTVVSRQVSTNPLVFEYRLILNNGPATENHEQRQQAA